MMNIDELRQNLLAEAKDSPMLFSDLAGLEEYVSESYNCRSFIELLQNADDAGATACEIGAMNLVDPFASIKIVEELPLVMQQYGITDLKEIIGGAH